MVTRYRMSINGTQLDSCLNNNETYKKYKDKIVLLDIGYGKPEFSRAIETAGDNDGGIITRTYRQKASVTVTFGLYIYNTADRFAVCNIIKTLASKGGAIRTNDRPGFVLENCVCDEYPEIESSKEWTEPLTMTFSDYSFPYWQRETYTVRSITGTSSSSSITVDANAPYMNAVVEMTAGADFPTNISYVTSGVRLTVGSTSLYISYPFKKNNYCLVDYDSNNNLRVRVYDNATTKRLIASILDYVLPASSDKLIARPGANTVSINALKTVTAQFKVRGAML